ncbi:FHA domain-containing protein [Acaryochloris sp. IP29b_bin.137]|uniref:FHA domain-containing protein n=1 Tax=Acaryochloris sp. IP29b_bin.137 TaxID=2969217 RepID=UPI0026375A49|nr:FHA domain-containing protein [Acaryochloris sp. IP29b_bin.137]
MTELTLEWVEGGVSRSEQIQPNQPSKHPGAVRIGRDPQKCDIVLSDGSVSGLQAEVYFHSGSQAFYLRSLRETNPAIVNGQPITAGEVPLGTASTITLGRVVLHARVSAVPGGLPPTEVSPSAVPPTAVSPPVPAAPAHPAPSPSPYYSSQSAADDQGPKVWVWIIAGVLVIGGGALAWPYVSNFLGLSREPSVSQVDSDRSDSDQDSPNSDSSPGSRRDSFGDKMADLVTYEHSSRLFRIKIPRTWRRRDTSKAGEVIVRWTDSETESSIVVDLFKSRRLSPEDLGDLSRRFITNAFGDEPGFRAGQPKVRDSGVVELGWEFSTRNNDQVLGVTYSQQERETVSVVSILVLRSDFDQVRLTFREILNSYRFDPSVAIP